MELNPDISIARFDIPKKQSVHASTFMAAAANLSEGTLSDQWIKNSGTINRHKITPAVCLERLTSM